MYKTNKNSIYYISTLKRPEGEGGGGDSGLPWSLWYQKIAGPDRVIIIIYTLYTVYILYFT